MRVRPRVKPTLETFRLCTDYIYLPFLLMAMRNIVKRSACRKRLNHQKQIRTGPFIITPAIPPAQRGDHARYPALRRLWVNLLFTLLLCRHYYILDAVTRS